MKKILWLSPNFNHYKTRFLNHLARAKNIELTVLSGTGRAGMGDQEIKSQCHFYHIQLEVRKRDFGKSARVRKSLKMYFDHYDWVLIPTEKKNLLLFVYALYLRKRHRETKLLTYTHPISKSVGGKITLIDRLITKFYYKQLDRVIFYTEQGSKWAIKNKLIEPKKAFWANNTIDTSEIKKYYTFELPPEKEPAILFIGRLIPSKCLNDLILYCKALKTYLPHLKLHVIGDGPERPIVLTAMEKDKNIVYHGTLIDEGKIAKVIKQCSIVFIPGHSGLSINHAFAYGRPYITCADYKNHPPEISYIEHGKNGYIFNNDFNENTNKLLELFSNRDLLTMFCKNAKAKGEELSIENWEQQMTFNLLHE